MTIYDVNSLLADKCYRSVLTMALQYCTMATVVVRPGELLSENGFGFIENLKLFNVHLEESSSWPGTKLFLEKAKIYWFDFDGTTVDFLTTVTDSLFKWQHPYLPEDLCLLRPNKQPWFVSITHEKDCYFELEDGEATSIREMIPQLGMLKKRARKSNIS